MTDDIWLDLVQRKTRRRTSSVGALIDWLWASSRCVSTTVRRLAAWTAMTWWSSSVTPATNMATYSPTDTSTSSVSATNTLKRYLSMTSVC